MAIEARRNIGRAAALRSGRTCTTRSAVALAMAACFGAGCAAARPRTTVAVAYRFHCTPADARVIVDEVDQGACRVYEVQYLGLPAGTHRFRVEREGYLPDERELASDGQRQTLTITLRPQPE